MISYKCFQLLINLFNLCTYFFRCLDFDAPELRGLWYRGTHWSGARGISCVLPYRYATGFQVGPHGL